MQHQPADTFLNSRQVRERYGHASDMWLWRRLNEDAGFPKPLIIRRRRFWRLNELVAYEKSLVGDDGNVVAQTEAA
jgi:hypothetical protein